MNPYLLTILVLLPLEFLVDSLADALDLRNSSEKLPEEVQKEFRGLMDEKRYAESQRYHREWMRFGLLRRSIFLLLTLGFLLGGGFNAVDSLARNLAGQTLWTGLIFAGLLILLRTVAQLPFSVHGTFGIETRYGFNKTSPRTFALDLLKSLVLGAVIGGPLFAGVVWFFESAGPLAWLYSWIFITLIQLIMHYLTPAVLLPLFNRFEPLPEGELRSEISKYMQSRGFSLQGIYTMDGSRRSTKANAFFTGFGKLRRLVLFDTLIAKQSVPELVAVLAHEVGHFQLRHIPKSITLSIATTGLILASFSVFIGNVTLSSAFGMEHVSVYSSLIFISFLYSPAMRFISIVPQAISRRFEFEADAFAARTTGKPESLASALKKLSADHLSNLTPHPLKVLLDYSHPPVLQRVRALRGLAVPTPRA